MSVRSWGAALLATAAGAEAAAAVTCRCLGGGGFGNECARWDAPDEQPWCRVAGAKACGEDDTFESEGHFWAHSVCGGEGKAYDPKVHADATKAGKPEDEARAAGAVPLARLQQHLYSFQPGGPRNAASMGSPIMGRACREHASATQRTLHGSFNHEKSAGDIAMANNFMIYANTRIVAQQFGWDLEMARTVSWTEHFPRAKLSVPGRPGRPPLKCAGKELVKFSGDGSSEPCAWKELVGSERRHQDCDWKGLAEFSADSSGPCTWPASASQQVPEARTCLSATRFDGGWAMDRLLPFKPWLAEWFEPSEALRARVRVAGPDEVVIHLRKCYIYHGGKQWTPMTAADMHRQELFCGMKHFMSDPQLEYFDRVIGDLKRRGLARKVWVVTGNRGCKRKVLKYLRKKWGAELYADGRDGIGDWTFLNSAQGAVVLTSGTFGTFAAWLSKAREVHVPVATTGKNLLVWNERRWVAHDVADDKWFGTFDRKLGRYVFRDGREGKVTDCERNVDQGDAYWKAFQTKAGPLACPTAEVGKQHWVRAQTGCPAHAYWNGDVVPFDGSVAEVASGSGGSSSQSQ